MRYSDYLSNKSTPQTSPIPGTNQVENSAGGYVWQLSKWEQLERFLILGCEGGTYYAKERDLTVENAKIVVDCAAEDAEGTVNIISLVSNTGRAPKNDPAIFALALVASQPLPATRAAAYMALPNVCRTATHLFHFCQAVQDMRGWSRGLRAAVSRWYNARSAEDIEYQLLKYKQRDGWTHRDVLRLAHPTPPTLAHAALYRHAVGKDVANAALPDRTRAALALHSDVSTKSKINLIQNLRLPREVVPTEMLKDKDTWDALLHDMPITAMIRNLGKMSAVGLADTNLSAATRYIVDRLTDVDNLRKGRVHPLQLLVALRTYSQGHGEKGKLKWTAVGNIVKALDDAFYLAFKAVKPTGKRIMIGLDVSGSMASGSVCGSSLTPREGSCAMALVTAATEQNHEIVAFSDMLMRLTVPTKIRLTDMVAQTSRIPFGRTDCSMPMQFAEKHGWGIDAFVIYTDNETYAGNPHPAQALKNYRKAMGIDAKMIVVGMTSTGFTIADPNDKGMLDVVGFDTNVPALISEFIQGG